MKYRVKSVEVQPTSTGKNPKKATLVDESGKEEPRVTLWEDDPSYTLAVEGATIEGNVVKKDSGTPIPAHPERNFVNRTFKSGDAPKTDSGLEARVRKLEKKVFTAEDYQDEVEVPF